MSAPDATPDPAHPAHAGPSAPPGLATPSLRRRTTLVVLVLLAAMLLAVAVVTDLVLGQRLDGQLRDRLLDRAQVAEALVDQVDPQDLVRRLEGDDVSVILRTADGDVYVQGRLATDDPAEAAGADPADVPDGAPAPPDGPGDGPGPTPPTPTGPDEVAQTGDLLSVDRELADGSTITLLAGASEVRRTLTQVRLALLLAALVALGLAALAVPFVVGRSLRPLDRITEVARSITRGDRGRRLAPRQPGSELGRTAVAFDEMLDEVVGAEQQARASEERLRDFLSDAAHDLRTPLAGVQAGAERLLREDPDRATREAALTGLVRETRRASRLVDDMLTMARIDRGLAPDELRRDPVDVRRVAREVVTAAEAAHPGVTLEVAGAADAVPADRDALVRVLTNLVGNAAQAVEGAGVEGGGARPEGAGHVRVTVSETATHVVVDVADDGPGVPAAERERVFERLVRLDRARTRRRAGAGLGLPIARGLARAHGGDLVCLGSGAPGSPGEPGVPAGTGATFRLTLPRG